MRQKIRLGAALCGLLCLLGFHFENPSKSKAHLTHIESIAVPNHFSLSQILRQDGDLNSVTAQSVSPPKVIYDPHPGGLAASRSAPLRIPPATTTSTAPTTSTTRSVTVVVTSSSAVPSGCLDHAMSYSQGHVCWDGLIDQYPWDHAEAFKILMCESTGKSNATNGRYVGLMQLDGGSADPVANIRSAYYDFYLGGGKGFRGWEPWSCR